MEGCGAMEMKKSQYERLLIIDREIRNGRFPSARDLGDMLEVCQRTVYRDVDFLRDRLQAPLVFDRGRNGYTYTQDNWVMQTLHLADSDRMVLQIAALALMQYEGTPLAEQMQALLQRHFMQTHTEDFNLHALREQFSVVPGVTCKVDKQHWTTVVEAILYRRTLSMDYRTSRDKFSEGVVVDPLHLTNLCGVWYMLARSQTNGRIKQFAVHRIERLDETGNSFSRPAHVSLHAMIERTFGRTVATEALSQIRVRVDSTLAPAIKDWTWHRMQSVEDLPDGDFILSFPADAKSDYPLRQVVQWVLSWGSRVRVLEPDSVREAVANEIRLMAKGIDT